jgi:hypothetical protein
LITLTVIATSGLTVFDAKKWEFQLLMCRNIKKVGNNWHRYTRLKIQGGLSNYLAQRDLVVAGDVRAVDRPVWADALVATALHHHLASEYLVGARLSGWTLPSG